jgi:PAS domain S-box-containing protein
MKQHLRVLLIEDNPQEADLIRDMLFEVNRVAFDLERVARLSHGLERLDEDSFDLLLLDLSLPDSEGFETFTRMHHHAPQIPIIVLTGLDDEELAMKAVREGAQDYLFKDGVNGDLLARSMRYASERKRAEEALRESEERYRLLAETAQDFILVHDLEGTITYANRAVFEDTGYDEEEVLRMRITDFVSEEAIPAITERRERRTDGDRERYCYETEYLTASGERIPIEVSSSPIAQDGKVKNILIVARDITERKEMEQQLRRQERLAAVGQLAAGIAHDFRNLLSTIILYSQLSMRNHDLPRELTRNLQTVINESYKATDLVQQILDFSSRAMISPQPLNMIDLVRDMLDVLDRTIPEHIHLSLDVQGTDQEAYRVQADAGRIQQALTNLALNARDAMPGGGDLRFTLSRVKVAPDERAPVADMPPGEWICLAVSDTGMGMSKEVQEHLFEPFFTTKEVGRGTGLGLAQVYGIVRQHKGHIKVETEPGQGTTFHIYFPAHLEEIEEANTRKPAPAPPGQGEMILLVEDEEKLREAGQAMLELLGYRVMTAANGREALAICQSPRWSGEPSKRIKLVITDLVMPEMGGEELMRELKRRKLDLRVLAITGYPLQEDKLQELKNIGFVNVISKPLEVDASAREIRRALDA